MTVARAAVGGGGEVFFFFKKACQIHRIIFIGHARGKEERKGHVEHEHGHR